MKVSRKVLLAMLSAVLASSTAADPRFEQAAIENFQRERASGLLFSRSNRCFVLTVARMIVQGPFQVRTAGGHGEARQLRHLPEHGLGLLEMNREDRRLCAMGELRRFDLPADLTTGSAGSAPAIEGLVLRRLAGGLEDAKSVGFASITEDELIVLLSDAVPAEDWDGAVLWRQRRYLGEPVARSEPVAILRSSRPRVAREELALLRLDRAFELVEEHLPRILLKPDSSAPGLRERPMPEALKPRLDTARWVLRPNAAASPIDSGLQISLDEGDWAPFPKAVSIPIGTRVVRLRETGREDGGYYRIELVQIALEAMLREARERQELLVCGESSCVFDATGILPVVDTVRVGARPDALTREFSASEPIAKYIDYRGRSTRRLPAPVCQGTVYYQVQLNDGYQTPVKSTEMRQKDDIVCPPAGFELDDPRILWPNEENGVPVFVQFETPLFQNRLAMTTSLDFELAAITWAYDDGFPTRQNRSSRELRFPADLESEQLHLELHLADGTELGPFSYDIDFFALKKLRALTQLDQRHFLQCFRVDPASRSHLREYVQEPAVVCLPRQHGGSNHAWIAVAAVEYGTSAGRLDKVEPVDASKVTYSDCYSRDPSKCFLALVLPWDTEAVHAKLRLWNGRRSETRQFVVE